jgi:ATP-dependent Clp protease ATP-binding subunit ClpA
MWPQSPVHRWTEHGRKVVFPLAQEEAYRFYHEYIGTEHLLLALVKEGSGIAVDVLAQLNIDLGRVCTEIEKIVLPGPEEVFTPGRLPQTPRAKKAIEYAIDEASSLGQVEVGAEHLLIGLLRVEEGVASQVLMNLGLRLKDLREGVRWAHKRQVIDPSWLSWNRGTVSKIALTIAEQRTFDELPVLADALEEAGCTDRDILGHLRRGAQHGCPARHVAGCWVLPLFLAPEGENVNPR